MIKLIIIILFLILYVRIKIFIKIRNKTSVCLCTIGKQENLYVKEFVDHYRNKGLDKIFIYDNNDINGEKFDMVIKDDIDSGFVDIVDIRGIVAPQIKAMEDCRKKNYKKFDWIIFYDMDEYIFLRNFQNIKQFLNQNFFKKCQRIQLNWMFHTDNNLIYYDNRTLAERFPAIQKKWINKTIGGVEGIKSILRGNVNTIIKNPHYLNPELISCDGFGKLKEVQGIETNESDHYFNYIDHYWGKSTEEFTNKLLKGSVAVGYNNTNHTMFRIKIYFGLCDLTMDKINYIENRTKLDLSIYKSILLNNTNNNRRY